ncbi:hypothetical protein [Nonomuraea sp. B19D2]|uniref:hypothetical protein n=1 Tax=Nonomuraea sp. B19D2 TaxID=3159561 RepID=UPI0032DAF130
MTTAEDVLDLFKVTSPTEVAFSKWTGDATKVDVVPHVMAHRVSFVYDLTPEDVERVCNATKRDRRNHALGDVKRKEAESVTDIVDWHPAFAFIHALHYAIESLREIPTWLEFSRFIRDDPKANAMLWNPACQMARTVSDAPDGPSWRVAWDSVRWRLGNAYYSFLREMYVVSNLRASGLDIRVHPLADALFKVDFWCGRTICSLFVKNAKFHKDNEGRKISPRQLMRDAAPKFHFHDIQLDKATEWGRVHLPSTEQLREAAERLRVAVQ